MAQTRLFADSDSNPAPSAGPVALAQVAVAARGAPADVYTYAVPASLADLGVGEQVAVTFNRRACTGVVVAIDPLPAPEAQQRTVLPIRDRAHGVRLPAPLVALLRWASRYYRCPLGQFIAGVLPRPVREGAAQAQVRWLRVADASANLKLSARQRQIVQALRLVDGPGWPGLSAAARAAACTPATLRRMIELGALSEDAQVQQRTQTTLAVPAERHALSADQSRAVEAVWQACEQAAGKTFLLCGVTGSGKTLVYLELAMRVAARGQCVLYLLPEIGLTPQLAARVRARLPRVVVWHSQMSDGERAAAWRTVEAGGCDVVLGCRSALFAPIANLGLIVVDEEHDHSFKQETQPRYQARDLAVLYGQQRHVPVLLGSATPSLESWHNAQQGRFTRLDLPTRPSGAALPTCLLVDMRAECHAQKRQAVLSGLLVDELAAALRRREQAIVLLNRRGWAPQLTCADCGAVATCPHCAVAQVFHRRVRALKCHYCGAQAPAPRHCAACGSAALGTQGVGSEQLEALLREALPTLRTVRLDADTVSTRDAHAQILSQFAAGQADCLVGTQMVAKGLDFPRVSVVGIVAADAGLAQPDFRAAERTYQLINQVAGRSGRSDIAGRVVVQAYDVQAPALVAAVRGEQEAFYAALLAERAQYGYPPAHALVRFVWRGKAAAAVERTALGHQALLESLCQPGERVLGPTPAGVPFAHDEHRWHALLKAPRRAAAQAWLDRLDAAGGLPGSREVSVMIDVDPYQTG